MKKQRSELQVYYAKQLNQFLLVDHWGRIINVYSERDGQVYCFGVWGYLTKSHVYIGEL